LDFFGNRITSIVLAEPHDTLTVRVAAASPSSARGGQATPAWEEVRAAAFRVADLSPQSPRIICSQPAGLARSEIRDYAAQASPGRPAIDGAIGPDEPHQKEFVHEVAPPPPPPHRDVLALRRGVCRTSRM